MSHLFTSGGQSIGVSASASVLPMNIQDWFPLGWTGWISLQSKGLSRVFSSITVWKHQFLSAQPPLWSSSPFHTWTLDQPCVSIYPLPLGSPSIFLSHPSMTSQSTKMSSLCLERPPTSCLTYKWLCMCIYIYIYIYTYISAPLSVCPSPSPRSVHKSVLHICASIPALQMGSSAPFF